MTICTRRKADNPTSLFHLKFLISIIFQIWQIHEPTMTQIQDIRNKLIGSWSLISSRTELRDSPDDEPTILYTIGKDAKGIIMFSSDGYVSTQLMRPGAVKWESNSLLGGTDEELADATRHFLAYAGTFDVESSQDETLVYVSVDLCSFPNWLGDRQERVVQLDGEVLKLTPPSFTMQVSFVITK